MLETEPEAESSLPPIMQAQNRGTLIDELTPIVNDRPAIDSFSREVLTDDKSPQKPYE